MSDIDELAQKSVEKVSESLNSLVANYSIVILRAEIEKSGIDIKDMTSDNKLEICERVVQQLKTMYTSLLGLSVEAGEKYLQTQIGVKDGDDKQD